jgi:hypothetical protein
MNSSHLITLSNSDLNPDFAESDSQTHLNEFLDVIPEIRLPFTSTEELEQTLHITLIRKSLKKLLPNYCKNLHLQSHEELINTKKRFHTSLPLLTSTSAHSQNTNEISFFALSHYRPNAFKFFFNMISNWLVPGKRLSVAMVYAIDFHLPQLCGNMFSLCEVKIALHNPEELIEIKKNLSIIESEIRLGMHSTYHANKILEIKGLSTDEKTALLHQYITDLIYRKPNEFTFDLLVEMQHTLLFYSDTFKQGRSLRHLSRIISLHYLFRKGMLKAIAQEPERRFVKLKLFKAQIKIDDKPKSVLAILLAINFLQKEEIFDQRHLLNAMQNHIPHIAAIEGSFFINRQHNEPLGRIYLEVYKSDDSDFSQDELTLMRDDLLHDLHDHIELPMHPIFMPRNEEEVMRNIVLLNKELNSSHAPPQVIISFDEQTHKALIFTVIVLRIVSPDHSTTIEQLFLNAGSKIEYLHDRYRYLGTIGDNMMKEASVFRLKLKKLHFLRQNFSVDLVKARQYISEELMNILGYFRDFNGGTLAKEFELLSALRQQLKGTKKFSNLLLETFFHSISPASMRSTLEPSCLKRLFIFLLDTHAQANNSDTPQVFWRCEESLALVLIRYSNSSGRKAITRHLHETLSQQGQWASVFVAISPISYAGYLMNTALPCQQQLFCTTINNAVLAP